MIFISSPIFASQNSQQDQLLKKLEIAEKILTKSDYEKYIAILEEKPTSTIKLPATLQSGDNFFTIYPEVVVDSPEYWITLTALYFHEGKEGKALDLLENMLKTSSFNSTDEHQRIIRKCITFFIEKSKQN